MDDDEAVCPEVLTSRVRQAFAQCRDCIAKELSLHEAIPSSDLPRRERPAAEQKRTQERSTSIDRNPRTATEAQIRAIRAIPSKAGLSLASELEQSFGVRSPNHLTIAQASQLIDSMKQNLAPSPV